MPTDYAKRKQFLTAARPQKVRREALSTISWKVPNGNEIREIIELIDMTETDIAEKLCIQTRTIRKWKSEDSHISFGNWFCLCWLAGLGPMFAEKPANLP